MGAEIIDGKACAGRFRARIAADAAPLVARGVRPGLAVVLAGDDPASQVYVRNKTAACVEAGFRTFDHRLPATTYKDVDGFHPDNLGRLLMGDPRFIACTPLGIMRLLEEAKTPLAGADAVVLGRSNIVGKPMAALLLGADCTVTVCHSRTRNLADRVRGADIVIAAVGRAEMVQGDWIKPGATVIDVGTNRRPDGKLVGDVAFAGAAERARAITPVPGGVGPMTIAMLLSNTLDSARRRAV